MTTDLRTAMKEAAAPPSRTDLTTVKARATVLRRRRGLASAAAIALPLMVVAGIAVAREPSTPPAARPSGPSTTQPPTRAESREANQRLIERLPVIENARFLSTTDADPPRGGVGVMTYVNFIGTDTTFDPQVAIDEYRATFNDWDVVADAGLPTRRTLTLASGPAWISVSTSPGTETRAGGFSVVVNSFDSEVLQRLVPSREGKLVVFLDDDATDAEIADIQRTLTDHPSTSSVLYLDHAAAHQEFSEMFKDDPALVQRTRPEELPRSFQVSLTALDAAEAVARTVAGLDGVKAAVCPGGSPCVP